MDDIGPQQPEVPTVDAQRGRSAQEPLAMRIPEACRIMGIGRSKLYELIGAGELNIVKVGAITLIPMDSLRQFIDSHRRYPAKAAPTQAACPNVS